MEKEAKIRLEIYEMIHQKFMKETDTEILDILEKIQKEILLGLPPQEE